MIRVILPALGVSGKDAVSEVAAFIATYPSSLPSRTEETGMDGQDVVRYGAAVAGLLPGGSVIKELTRDALETVRLEQTRLTSIALRAAESSAGMSREELSDQIASYPHLVPIVTRVLWSAGMNGDEEVLMALGGVLGSILLTPNDTDEAEMILAAIANFKRPHLQVLRVMDQPPYVRVPPESAATLVEVFEAALGEDEAKKPLIDPDGLVTQSAETWNVEALAHASGLAVTRAQLAVAGLMSGGLVVSPAVLDGPGYRLSPSGQVVFEAVQRWQEHS